VVVVMVVRRWRLERRALAELVLVPMLVLMLAELVLVPMLAHARRTRMLVPMLVLMLADSCSCMVAMQT